MTSQRDSEYKKAEYFFTSAPRHIIILSRYLQSHSMETLRQHFGHPHLRLYYEPYLSMLGSQGIRLTELARLLGVTKQACNQTANQIEALGYIQREQDPTDGRAKLLRLSNKGWNLIQQAYQVTLDVERRCKGILGEVRLNSLKSYISQLSACFCIPNLRLSPKEIGVSSDGVLLALLPRVSSYAEQRLKQALLSAAQGELREIHVQLLLQMGEQGSTVKSLADANEVSRPAIFSVANELIEYGFIESIPDPLAPRQHRLVLTDQGTRLLNSAMKAIIRFEAEFKEVLGDHHYALFNDSVSDLVKGLGLVNRPQNDDELLLLARRLKMELGAQRARSLSMMLYE